jgi:hypothetical protein
MNILTRKTAGIAAAFILLTSAGYAIGQELPAAGASLQGPTTADDGAYNSVVHLCVSQSNEGRVYVEEHTSPGTIGNCAAGYVQAELNVPWLAPVVTIKDAPAPSTATPSPSPTATQTCTTVQNSQGAGGADPNRVAEIDCSG